MGRTEKFIEYKDGSKVKASANQRDKWIAITPKGDFLLDDNGHMRHFDTEEEATAALVNKGFGPAA